MCQAWIEQTHLCKFNLKPCFVCPGMFGKYIKYQLSSINDFALNQFFDISYLSGRSCASITRVFAEAVFMVCLSLPASLYPGMWKQPGAPAFDLSWKPPEHLRYCTASASPAYLLQKVWD
jgi:hypothetical protein